MSRNVLVISYYWPPAGGPGALRVLNFCRFLPRFGWNPIVLTVKDGEYPYTDNSLTDNVPPGIHVYRTKSRNPFAAYRRFTGKRNGAPIPVGMLADGEKRGREKIAAWIRAQFFIPDARIGWFLSSVAKVSRIIKNEKIDLVFTSSPPHSLQLFGLYIRKISMLPWIADLRDPWTGIRYYQNIKRAYLTRKGDEFLERAVLRSADHVVTIGRSLAAQFTDLKKSTPGKNSITVIPNGFDEAQFGGPAKRTKKFRIAYTGNMSALQNPSELWRSLSDLANKNTDFKKNISLHFTGRIHTSILNSLTEYGLGELTHTRGYVPHHESIEEIKNASLLLVIVPRVENNRCIVTGKIFEYIGSGKPVLVIGPVDGEAAEIIGKVSNGAVCDYEDTEGCSLFIENIYSAWKKKKLPESEPEERRLYSRETLTAKLAELFDAQMVKPDGIDTRRDCSTREP